jgi:hypothetical protein
MHDSRRNLVDIDDLPCIKECIIGKGNDQQVRGSTRRSYLTIETCNGIPITTVDRRDLMART